MKKLLALVLLSGLLMPLVVGCGDDASKKPADKKAPAAAPAADKKGPATPPAADKKEK